MAANLSPLWRELGTQGLSLTIRGLTGEAPTIERYVDHNKIILTASQKATAQQFLMDSLNKEPGPIRLEIAEILVPVVIKKYWPIAAAVAGTGAILGFLLGKRR